MRNIYIYIMVMALVTYLIRVLPLTLIRGEIKSKWIRSFLYYVPFATLSAMTFPAILKTEGLYFVSSMAGLIAALFLAYCKKSLLKVAAGACLAAFVFQLVLLYWK